MSISMTEILFEIQFELTLVLFFMPWHFIPRDLETIIVWNWVLNDCNGYSETVNVLARHTA